MNWNRFQIALIWVALAAMPQACASQPAPTKQLADSEAAVRVATELGAQDFPEAAKQLQMARMHMNRADVLLRKGNNRAAGRVLDEARADAELAVALVRERQVEQSADSARQRLESEHNAESSGEGAGSQ